MESPSCVWNFLLKRVLCLPQQSSPCILHALPPDSLSATFGNHLGEVEIKCKPEGKPHQSQVAKK